MCFPKALTYDFRMHLNLAVKMHWKYAFKSTNMVPLKCTFVLSKCTEKVSQNKSISHSNVP